MDQTRLGWLAAEYNFPATYSCRLPFSSPNSALISPAPGPATVRLALIRVGIEIFGKDVVRGLLFPTIRAASVCIRPPERVAISGQVLKAYKAVEKTGSESRWPKHTAGANPFSLDKADYTDHLY